MGIIELTGGEMKVGLTIPINRFTLFLAVIVRVFVSDSAL
jgi:hypothetical protein